MSISLNSKIVPFATYPNGEAIVPLLDNALERGNVVRLHWTSDSDLINLMFLRGMLAGDREAILHIDYMPYSRMDRAQDGHCFSLQYVSEFINKLVFDQVVVCEPHSQVTLDLLEASRAVYPSLQLLHRATTEQYWSHANDFVVFPDAGACKRYLDLESPVIEDANYIVMNKIRDFSTGKINGLDIDHQVIRRSRRPKLGGRAVIVDDLCSRGGTFIGAADLLRTELQFQKIDLAVTHLEEAANNRDLGKSIDTIFATDTVWSHPSSHKVRIYKKEDLT